jgi:hypothetical protein
VLCRGFCCQLIVEEVDRCAAEMNVSHLLLVFVPPFHLSLNIWETAEKVYWMMGRGVQEHPLQTGKLIVAPA